MVYISGLSPLKKMSHINYHIVKRFLKRTKVDFKTLKRMIFVNHPSPTPLPYKIHEISLETMYKQFVAEIVLIFHALLYLVYYKIILVVNIS